jgi:hypothetical protein
VALGLVTLVSAFAAVKLVEATSNQNHIADRQNEVAKQESEIARQESLTSALTTLVAELTHESRALVGANPAQATAINQARLADAGEAHALAGQLSVVSAVDNYEVGQVFVEEGENGKALDAFTKAGNKQSDPRYRAQALLKRAELLFRLGGKRYRGEARYDTTSLKVSTTSSLCLALSLSPTGWTVG